MMSQTRLDPPGIVVAGGANVDIKARSNSPLVTGTSNPGVGSVSPGGVARNIAENLARLGSRVDLIAAIGLDALGDSLWTQTAAAGVRMDAVLRCDEPTGTYTVLLDHDGEMVAAVAAMVATTRIDSEWIRRSRELIATSSMLVLDANLSPDPLECAYDIGCSAGVPVVLEPVSVAKAAVIAGFLDPSRPIFALTPNLDELAALTGASTRTDSQVRRAAASLHQRGVEHVWVRLGEQGSLMSSANGETTRIPAVSTTVVDVTGAGDSMLAAFCHAVLCGRSHVEAARFGHGAAAVTIASTHTVRPDLTDRLIWDTIA